MKILVSSLIVLLFQITVVAETILCKDVRDLYSEDLNLSCKSSTGRIFHRVYNKEIADYGWKDQTTNIVWYDTIKSIDGGHKTIAEVFARCTSNGLSVPSKEQFDDAGVNGLSDLFLRAYGWNRISALYTSTFEPAPKPEDQIHIYIFSTNSYRVIGTLPTRASKEGGALFKPRQPIVYMEHVVCISE